MVTFAHIEDLPNLPGLENSDQEYTLDYGGSLLKMLYRQKSDSPEMSTSLKLAILHLTEAKDLLPFIYKNVDVRVSEEIYTTGIGVSQDSVNLEQVLKRRITNLPEFDCFSKALRFLLPQVPRHQLFYPLYKEEFEKGYRVAKGFGHMETQLRKEATDHSFGNPQQPPGDLPAVEQLYSSYGDGDLLPAIIVMCSSGFPFIKYMDHNTGTQSLDYSPRGGRTLMGLGSALTGAKTFQELMELAAKGTSTNLDTYMGDLKARRDKTDFYHLFPDESYCFSFGKAAGKSQDQMSVEDLAASVVMNVCSDLCQLSLNHALSNKITNVILCGTMVTHPVIQKAVTFCFMSRSLGYLPEIQPKLRICTMGPYLGAIGAWIAGMEQQQSMTNKNPDSTES